MPPALALIENSNAVVVPLSDSGGVDLGVNCGAGCVAPTTDARLTVLGWLAEPDEGDELEYEPITPCAAFDSRTSKGALPPFGGLYDAGEARSFQITGPFPADQGGGNTDCGVPPGAAAVFVNLVAVGSTTSGTVGAGPGGTVPSHPLVSHAPLTPPMNNSNAVVLPLSADG
ncbi:MAG: hypothetical protein GY713_02885 [Actinomycetia bacterium]|nr:hypothetical protein [Actinomycetes bacterium]